MDSMLLEVLEETLLSYYLNMHQQNIANHCLIFLTVGAKQFTFVAFNKPIELGDMLEEKIC